MLSNNITQDCHTTSCPPTFPVSPFLLPDTLFLPPHSSGAVPESPQLQKGYRAKAQPFSHESKRLTINCLISCVPVSYVHTVGKMGNIIPEQISREPDSEGAEVVTDYNHRPGLGKCQGFKKQGQY